MPLSHLIEPESINDLDIDQLRSVCSLHNALLNAAVDAIIAIDARGIIKLFNKGAENLFGYRAQEVIDRNISCLMPQQFAVNHDRYMENYHSSGKAKIIGVGRDVEGLKNNGEVFPLHLSVGEADTPAGKLYIGICHDLSNYKSALVKLHSAEQRYREIVESQTELIMRLDSDLRLTFINPAMCRLFKFGEEAMLLGSSLLEHVHPDDRIGLKRQFAQFSDGDVDVETLLVRMRPTGEEIRWIEWRVRSLKEPGQLDSWEFQGFGVDITEQLQAREQVAFIQSHDPLTGLLNQKGFIDRLNHHLNKSDQVCGLITLNLDRFDLVNETLNQDAGDGVLKIAAKRIKNSLASSDLCARLNADQFIVMLSGTHNAKDLRSATLRLQKRLAEVYTIELREFNLTACAGISLCPDNGVTSESLMRRAEAALREAKSLGRSEMVFFSAALEEKTKSNAELELGIRQALEADLFELAYQPKHYLGSNHLQGFEVLIRWFHPEWGPVSPARFIPFAEANGLIVRIGQWVLEQAFRQWRVWADDGLNVPQMAINISSKQLESRDFIQQLQNLLNEYAIPADAIELEITEGAALSQTQEQIRLIKELRDIGFHLAIDDFGTGYSSLSQLSSLPANTLKIDRAFVSKITTDTLREPVIEAVVALGHSLGMEVVAEGVETTTQRDFLSNCGCDIAQGYLYSKPVSAGGMREILAAQH